MLGERELQEHAVDRTVGVQALELLRDLLERGRRGQSPIANGTIPTSTQARCLPPT